MAEFELEMLAPNAVLAPKEAVERVRENDRAHRTAIDALNATGVARPADYDYETAKLHEEQAFQKRREARAFLRQHILATYGVSLDDLRQLSAG